MHIERNLMIAGAGLATVIGLTAVLFIWPNYRQAAVARSEATQLREKMALLEGQAQALHQLESEVSETLAHIDTQLKVIPDVPDVATVIRKLSQEVDRVTVVDQTFTAGSPCDAIPGQSSSSNAIASQVRGGSQKQRPSQNNQPVLQAMPLNVDMEASFDSLFALIRNAESLERLVRITSVRAAISTTKVERPPGSPPLLKAAIGLEAIYQPIESVTGDNARITNQSAPTRQQTVAAEGS